MPIYRHILAQSKLRCIVVSSSSYDTGNITLVFDESTQVSALSTELATKVNKPLMALGSSILGCNDINNVRIIIDHLISTGDIDEQDRPYLTPILRQVDQDLENRRLLSYTISSSQKEIALSVIDVYVDDIVECSTNHEQATTLLRSGFYQKLPSIINELNQFIQEEKLDATVIGSVEALWKLSHGQGNLESSYRRMNQNVPTLLGQRNFIFDSCLQKLCAKFSDISEEDRILTHIGLEIFRIPNQTLSPLANTKKIIVNALSEPFESVQTQSVFPQSGLMPAVTGALSFVGILSKDGPNIDRIKHYQNQYQSKQLAEYLQELEMIAKQSDAEMNNSLLAALTSNIAKKVSEALEHKPDINQHFLNSWTPLIFAVMDCSDEILDLILAAKPDVDLPNSYKLVRALYQAIENSRVYAVKRLLESDASVFYYYQRIISTGLFSPATAQYAPIIMMAIDKYNKAKSPESAEIVKLLLHYGAGLGFACQSAFELFDKAVLIGGSFPSSTSAQPILTLAQFKKNIDPKDYPHWIKIILKAVKTDFFHNNAEILSMLASLHQFITVKSDAKFTIREDILIDKVSINKVIDFPAIQQMSNGRFSTNPDFISFISNNDEYRELIRTKKIAAISVECEVIQGNICERRKLSTYIASEEKSDFNPTNPYNCLAAAISENAELRNQLRNELIHKLTFSIEQNGNVKIFLVLSKSHTISLPRPQVDSLGNHQSTLFNFATSTQPNVLQASNRSNASNGP